MKKKIINKLVIILLCTFIAGITFTISSVLCNDYRYAQFTSKMIVYPLIILLGGFMFREIFKIKLLGYEK